MLDLGREEGIRVGEVRDAVLLQVVVLELLVRVEFLVVGQAGLVLAVAGVAGAHGAAVRASVPVRTSSMPHLLMSFVPPPCSDDLAVTDQFRH